MAAEPSSKLGKTEPEMARVDAGPMMPEFLRLDHHLLELAGEVDVENRYLPAVMITAMSGEEGVMGCSGVAISSHVVLTVGHCICMRKPVESPTGGTQAIIDTSTCFKGAKVETVFYKSQVEKGASLRGTRTKAYRGEAHPHPALRIMLDGQGRVVSSRADLALIVLDKPLELPGVALSDQSPQLGDSIIIVGYGYDEVAQVFGWERRFSMNTITRLTMAEDERFLVEQPGGHRYRQDSGGPCLRQEAKGPVLVGLSSRWLGEGAAFTSLHGYRDWVRKEVLRAETSASIHQ